MCVGEVAMSSVYTKVLARATHACLCRNEHKLMQHADGAFGRAVWALTLPKMRDMRVVRDRPAQVPWEGEYVCLQHFHMRRAHARRVMALLGEGKQLQYIYIYKGRETCICIYIYIHIYNYTKHN